MTTSPPTNDAGGDLMWAMVEDGFYVASNALGFVGYIDRVQPDSFQVCNAQSQQLGFFPDLENAIACLGAAHRAENGGENARD